MDGLSAQTSILPKARKRAVYGADFYVSPSKYDYSSVARQIVGNAQSEYEKAMLIYGWICNNVIYDNRGVVRTADECWNLRKAVCQGYCELFYRLAETQGLQMRIIYGLGKARVVGTYEQHSWICVMTDGREILLDPTWGAGYMVGGKFAKNTDPMEWFDVQPEWFVFTHLPNNDKNQLIDTPITRKQFDKLPYMTSLISRLGIDPTKALRATIAEDMFFPVVIAKNSSFLKKIEVNEVPHNYYLKVGKPYTFSINKLEPNCSVMLQLDGETVDESRWDDNGGTSTITFTPNHSGMLRLVISLKRDYFDLKLPVVEWMVVK